VTSIEIETFFETVLVLSTVWCCVGYEERVFVDIGSGRSPSTGATGSTK
jgi:hypothetical protein